MYILLVANEYGRPDGDLSATHHEYRLAQELQLPTMVFIKGAAETGRSPETRELIEEVRQAGHTYKRFHDREDLKPEMLRALMRTLADTQSQHSPAIFRKSAKISLSNEQ